MKTGKIEKKNKELWKCDDFAEIYELQNYENDENGLRIYCRQFPDVFLFQIRTFKSILEHRKGKKRSMVAHLQLSIKDIEQILEYMKHYSC